MYKAIAIVLALFWIVGVIYIFIYHNDLSSMELALISAILIFLTPGGIWGIIYETYEQYLDKCSSSINETQGRS